MRLRCLNKSPSVLGTALSRLQSQHLITGSKIHDLLSRAAQRYSHLGAKIVAPSRVNTDASSSGGVGQMTKMPADRLYQASYQHAGASGAACDLCCDEQMLVQRLDDERPSNGEPAVHYGIIASGTLKIPVALRANAPARRWAPYASNTRRPASWITLRASLSATLSNMRIRTRAHAGSATLPERLRRLPRSCWD